MEVCVGVGKRVDTGFSKSEDLGRIITSANMIPKVANTNTKNLFFIFLLARDILRQALNTALGKSC